MKSRCVRITCKSYEEKMSMEVKTDLRNSILLTLSYGSETWTWNRTQQSRVCVLEMSYLRNMFPDSHQ